MFETTETPPKQRLNTQASVMSIASVASMVSKESALRASQVALLEETSPSKKCPEDKRSKAAIRKDPI